MNLIKMLDKLFNMTRDIRFFISNLILFHLRSQHVTLNIK